MSVKAGQAQSGTHKLGAWLADSCTSPTEPRVSAASAPTPKMNADGAQDRSHRPVKVEGSGVTVCKIVLDGRAFGCRVGHLAEAGALMRFTTGADHGEDRRWAVQG